MNQKNTHRIANIAKTVQIASNYQDRLDHFKLISDIFTLPSYTVTCDWLFFKKRYRYYILPHDSHKHPFKKSWYSAANTNKQELALLMTKDAEFLYVPKIKSTITSYYVADDHYIKLRKPRSSSSTKYSITEPSDKAWPFIYTPDSHVQEGYLDQYTLIFSRLRSPVTHISIMEKKTTSKLFAISVQSDQHAKKIDLNSPYRVKINPQSGRLTERIFIYGQGTLLLSAKEPSTQKIKNATIKFN